jgi:hypothetical protein
VFSGRLAALCAALCLTALVSGCGDDEDPGGAAPTETPASSDTSTSATEPTEPPEPSVEPATGPEMRVKAVSLRLPDDWHVDNTDASFMHVGAADDRTAVINLSSFPALDPDVSIARLAQSTQKTGSYPPGSVLPPTTMAGQPAFHVAGRVVGDDHEEFGLIHDGEIVAVEFIFLRGPKAGRQELIESVLATVELG